MCRGSVRWTWTLSVLLVGRAMVAPPASGLVWREVYRSPYEVAGFPAIDVRTSRDIWLAGERHLATTGDTSFTVHLDGSAWRVVPTPEPPGKDWLLHDITGVSGDRAWAVGEVAGARSSGLVLRWDGTAWHRLRSPRGVARLTAIDIVPGTTAFLAVGSSTRGRPLLIRWTGDRWRRQRLPDGVRSGTLNGVDAETRWRAWAVGESGGGSLVLRSTRRGWRRVSSPPLRGRPLGDVAAIGPDVAFALAGSSVILRWNGDAWRAIPRIWPRVVQLQALDAGGGLAWVTGVHPGWSTSAFIRPFTMRWDGGWRVEPVPRISNGFTRVSTDGICVWAAGPLDEGEANAGVFRRCR